MKRITTLLIFLFCLSLYSQSLEGSWKLVSENGVIVSDKEIVRIYEDGYFAEGAKDSESNEFLYALGGEYSSGDYTETLDFHTEVPGLVGNSFDPKLTFINEDKIQLNNVRELQVWERISKSENDLSGNWVITGRQRNGEMNTMTPGDRRTIKILGGGRFQWVAFNSATGDFYGTGGGVYKAEDGKYTEIIDFFSRDKNRVGDILVFDYEVKDGKWHHSGKSSKGDPMYEIWSPYAEAYKK